tara:strand:+ start:2469 stop:3206 length:738 start_codon:yes stop_codon:yes gene_type:complete
MIKTILNTIKKPDARILMMPVALFALSSCTSLALGTGVFLGTASVQEGGLSRAASDARIQAEINQRWFSYNVDMFTKLDMTVNQGRVLLTGVVQDPQHRVEAVRLAWQPAGVVQVINEIKVADSEGIVGYAKDAWISGRIRAALILDRDVESINYSIDTVQGSVYLMGFAQDQGELNHVVGIARTVGGVKRVVSYVKLVGTPETREGAQNYQPAFDNTAGNGAVGGAAGDAQGDPITWDTESVYQ